MTAARAAIHPFGLAMHLLCCTDAACWCREEIRPCIAPEGRPTTITAEQWEDMREPGRGSDDAGHGCAVPCEGHVVSGTGRAPRAASSTTVDSKTPDEGR